MKNSDNNIEQDYEIIDYWRENLSVGEFVCVPRIIRGLPLTYLNNLSQEAIVFDAVNISRQHLDSMTNKEVVQFLQNQAHTIN